MGGCWGRGVLDEWVLGWGWGVLDGWVLGWGCVGWVGVRVGGCWMSGC